MGSETVVPTDVPVVVHAREPLRSELISWIEGDVGWQIVSETGALVPQGIITDESQQAQGAVVVVDHTLPGDEKADMLRRCLRAGALDVVEWPDERDRLVAAVLTGMEGDLPSTYGRAPSGAMRQAAGRHRRSPDGRRMLCVAGVSGGAGASTVALALAGWAAWSGARTIVAGDDDLLALCGLSPWTGPGTPEIGQLAPRDAGRELDSLALVVPGVPRLRVLGGGGTHLTSVDEWSVDLVICDYRGLIEEAEVVVAVPDSQLRTRTSLRHRMLLRTPGSVGRREATRLLGGSPWGWIQHDPRVFRAGMAGRVPSGVPGTWLKELAGTVAVRPGDLRPRGGRRARPRGWRRARPRGGWRARQ